MSNILRSYNSFLISQRKDGYLNATEMCKASGKLMGHYLELKSTDAYLQALSSDIGLTISKLVAVVKGGIATEHMGTSSFSYSFSPMVFTTICSSSNQMGI